MDCEQVYQEVSFKAVMKYFVDGFYEKGRIKDYEYFFDPVKKVVVLRLLCEKVG